jgi:Ca-activated chloride channel family protein
VEQRAEKKRFLESERLADQVALAPAAARASNARGFGLGAGGRSGGAFGPAQGQGGQMMAGKPAFGITVKDAQGRSQVVASVRQLGAKTFYYKNSRWVDSSVTDEEEAKANVVDQFSDAFFRLARSQASDFNQYLTFDEPVTVRLADGVYRIEQAKR